MKWWKRHFLANIILSTTSIFLIVYLFATRFTENLGIVTIYVLGTIGLFFFGFPADYYIRKDNNIT